MPWPCRSKKNFMGFCLCNCVRYFLILCVYGVKSFIKNSLHCLFKSNPAKLHRDDPWITPSGLTIGITNTWYFCNNKLTSSAPLNKWSIILSQIKELTVSQGCCLAVIKMVSLFYEDYVHNRTPGMTLSAKVWPNRLISMLMFDYCAFFSMEERCCAILVYV